MPDGGVLETILIGTLLTTATTVISESLKPGMPKVPSPGANPNPGGIPSADQAALKARLRARRGLDSLRIDPASGGVPTGLQVPGG